MKSVDKQTKNKTQVFYIVTKYRSNPFKLDFYTLKGKKVDKGVVEKKVTKEGIHFYAPTAAII